MGAAQPGERRLFVALPLPEPVRADLSVAVAAIRDAEPVPAGGGGPGAPLPGPRWTEPRSWHLTLVFCGSVSPAVQARLVDRLGRTAARHRPLALAISGGGRFGHRVLWAGVTGDRAALVALAAATARAARAARVVVEARPYRPHLTIARGRPRDDLEPAASALRGYHGPTWTSPEILLVESQLGAGPGGTSRHVAVQSFPLG